MIKLILKFPKGNLFSTSFIVNTDTVDNMANIADNKGDKDESNKLDKCIEQQFKIYYALAKECGSKSISINLADITLKISVDCIIV